MRTERLHLLVPEWLKLAIKDRADELGISMSEYIKDNLKETVKRESKTKVDDN